jgi:gluconolactonase
MSSRASILRAGFALIAPLALGVAGCSGESKRESANPASTPQTTAAPEAQSGAGPVRLDAALDALVARGTKVERVANGYTFVEGPLWRNGELWFSDLVGNTLNAVGADGRARVLMQKAGGLETIPPGSYMGSNALAHDKDGAVLLAQHGLRRIARLDAQFQGTTLVDRFEGKRLNSPNDMVFHPDGSLWFTDPPYGLPGQDKDPAKEVPFNGVYRWADGRLEPMIRDLTRPNGLAFSPDGKALYVANSGPEMFIVRYDVGAGGRLSNGRHFFDFPSDGGQAPPDVPDGLKVDAQGNVWATGPGGIRIVTPEGRVLGQIRLPEVAANLAFGGPDLKTLYITASTSIYRMPVLVAGAPPVFGNQAGPPAGGR